MTNTNDFNKEVNTNSVETEIDLILTPYIPLIQEVEVQYTQEQKQEIIELIRSEEQAEDLDFYYDDIELNVVFKSTAEIEEDKKDQTENIEVKSYEEDLETFLQEFSLLKRGNQTEVCRIHKNGLIDFHDLKAFHEYHKKHNYILGKDKKTYISRIWQEHKDVRQFSNIVFDPSFKSPKGYLNLFKPWKARPISGDVSMFLELIEVLCSYHKESYEYLLNYLAHMVQQPGMLPLVAIVIRSLEKGVGKGTLAKLLSRLTDNFKHLQRREDLIGQFNGHLADAFVVIADELAWAGNKQDNDIMKGLITEEFVTINGKFKDQIQVRNFKRLFIFSNNNFCAPVEIGDRRFFVVDADGKLKHTAGWFKKFNKWMDTGGFNQVFNFLMKRNIEGFDPEIFPTTQSRIDLMKRNLSPVQKFVYEIFNGSIVLSDSTYEQKSDSCQWDRAMLAKDCQEWLKSSGTNYYDNTLKDDISKELNSIFDFAKANKNWRTNWKNTKGHYFYKLPKTDKECQKLIAKNLFNSENTKWVYETFTEQPEEEIIE